VTTPLKDSPVFRELEYEIEGRRVIIGMEMPGDRPIISCRLKGNRGWWYIDAARFADLVSQYPKETNGREVPVQSTEEYEKIRKDR
jgi:hypothetical protein